MEVDPMSYQDFSRDQLEEAISELEDRIDELEAENQRIMRAGKKAKADFENYKKRERDRKKRWQDQARRELAEDLITVLDNLERAIMTADEDSAVLQGVKMVADQLYTTLEKRGLQRIDAEGEEFDPRLHNAVDTRHHPEDNRVLEEKRKGYMYQDNVLREADVIVGKNTDTAQ